jgi:hypothetical protein
MIICRIENDLRGQQQLGTHETLSIHATMTTNNVNRVNTQGSSASWLKLVLTPSDSQDDAATPVPGQEGSASTKTTAKTRDKRVSCDLCTRGIGHKGMAAYKAHHSYHGRRCNAPGCDTRLWNSAALELHLQIFGHKEEHLKHTAKRGAPSDCRLCSIEAGVPGHPLMADFEEKHYTIVKGNYARCKSCKSYFLKTPPRYEAHVCGFGPDGPGTPSMSATPDSYPAAVEGHHKTMAETLRDMLLQSEEC